MAPFFRCATALGGAVIAGVFVGCSAPHDARPQSAAPAPQQSPPPIHATSDAPPTAGATAPRAAIHAEQTAPSDERATAATAPTDAEPAPPKVVADYQAPFPDRVDLFVPPKRVGGAPSAAQGGNDAAVELMGFVRVDRQRALLSINGEITSMAEGDSQYGVEVISVHPPNVVLQRGRQRWQATLE